MGYTTEFTGRVAVDPPLNEREAAYIRRFADTRRMQRTKGPYYTGTGFAGQDRELDITEYNTAPDGQPGLWCSWAPTEDRAGIEWNGVEKFYYADQWMAYLIDTFLKPGAELQLELTDPIEGRYYAPEFEHFTFDHIVNGQIDAEGEAAGDRWTLVVTDNMVERREVDIADGDAAVQALIDDGWLGYPDGEITGEDLKRIVELVRGAS
jgi:hypothetical protein